MRRQTFCREGQQNKTTRAPNHGDPRGLDGEIPMYTGINVIFRPGLLFPLSSSPKCEIWKTLF